MQEPLPDDGLIRKLWMGEADAYRDHLLRLDPASRSRRFSGGISDDFIARHAASADGVGAVVLGFFVDGVLRGAAELRPLGSFFSREAEAALSVEKEWQSLGVGTALLARALLTARNRGIASLHIHYLADNHRMRQLAGKFEAQFKSEFGGGVAEIGPLVSTPVSLMSEALDDAVGFASAMLDAQQRLFGTA
jgi:GNAT superfamily N-acetyltransferase